MIARDAEARNKMRMSLLVMVMLSGAMGCSSNGNADLLLTNGNVYTVNDRQPRAQAIAIRGDRIVFVGSNDNAKKFAGRATRVIDLGGKTVVPGLTDSHCHLLGIGQREITLNLEGTQSIDDFLSRVQQRVRETESAAWVTGRGWIDTYWQPPVFPTRRQLDQIAPDNPVYLIRADGHGAVANSAALKIAGISKDTPSPFGGQIVKDKSTGEPTGMLLDAA